MSGCDVDPISKHTEYKVLMIKYTWWRNQECHERALKTLITCHMQFPYIVKSKKTTPEVKTLLKTFKNLRVFLTSFLMWTLDAFDLTNILCLTVLHPKLISNKVKKVRVSSWDKNKKSKTTISVFTKWYIPMYYNITCVSLHENGGQCVRATHKAHPWFVSVHSNGFVRIWVDWALCITMVIGACV